MERFNAVRRPAGRTVPRRRFLEAAGAASAGLAVAGVLPHAAHAVNSSTAACGESVLEIIKTALVAEQLATTFYYTGLTTPAIMADPRTAGSSADPNAVAYDGNPVNVAYLQAALDQEQKHARLLANAGATSPFTHFYFPATTFHSLGFTNQPATYLWVLDHLETAFIGAYLAAAQRFSAIERIDLAVVALRILAVECQHRALYRVISEDDPADNVTMEVADFSCVADAVSILAPFLTGRGFPGGAGPAVPLPTAEQTVLAIGVNTSS
jgi:hypothetical protein